MRRIRKRKKLGLGASFDLARQVAADVAAFWVGDEPGFEVRDFLEVGVADAGFEGLFEGGFVFGVADLALIGGGENEVELGMEPLALESFPFALVEPHSAGDRAEINMEFKAVANLVADEHLAGFRAEERAAVGIVGENGRAAIGQRTGFEFAALLPGVVAGEWNPEAVRLGTFPGCEPRFDFTGFEANVGKNGAAHKKIIEKDSMKD